jgi:hypothetical protein
MSRIFPPLLILAVFCDLPAAHAQQGRLQQVREEVRGEEESGDSSCKKGRTASDPDCACDEDCFPGEIVLHALIAPFWAPAALLGDDYQRPGSFLAHPYAHDLPGYMRIDGYHHEHPGADSPPLEPSRLKCWMGRLTLQDSHDFRGLNRASALVLLDTSTRFGVQTGWTYLHERLDGGRSDELVLGDITLTFRFAQNPWVQMRAGLGARILADHGDGELGFNFTYGADCFPVKPLVLSVVMDAGTVGEAGLFHGRATVGVTRRGWELFTGYDYLRIGSVAIHGPALGLRYWF